VADASTKSKGKPAKRAFVRVKPGSIVDVVDLPGVQVRRGRPVELSASDARDAVRASHALELVEKG
jgi:hypothetical protein